MQKPSRHFLSLLNKRKKGLKTLSMVKKKEKKSDCLGQPKRLEI